MLSWHACEGRGWGWHAVRVQSPYTHPRTRAAYAAEPVSMAGGRTERSTSWKTGVKFLVSPSRASLQLSVSAPKVSKNNEGA
eukprot:364555-Chlamydomonas_euryale.AAC.3